MTGHDLSPRQRQVLALIADGHSHEAISGELGISVGVSRKYAAQTYRRLGARNAAQAVAVAMRAGVLS